LVLRAKRDDIPVNYIQLAKDLFAWQSSYRKDKIKLAWGKEFWIVSADWEVEKPESEADTNG